MSANFLKLPSELRNKVYNRCLLLEEPIDPWINYNRQQQLTPGLLCTNKAIHREASSLFYAQNRFNFTMSSPTDTALFLRTIGRNNAGCIRHVCVNFPDFYLHAGGVTLGEGSMSIFASIQSSCANLSTLITAPYCTLDIEEKLEELDNPKITEVLKLINTCFRAILSLQEIIVIVYEDDPSSFIRSEMEKHGWIISVMEDGKEW